MQPQAPEQCAGHGRRGIPLWLAALFVLALLLAAPLAKAHAEEVDHPGNPLAATSLELAIGGASTDAWLTSTPEAPHCHHDHAWRPAPAVLPRSESPDNAPEPTSPMTQLAGPSPHLTSPLGHAHPGPTVRHSAPLYLLTQRFRS
jgi:hypothetical protein